MPVTPLAPGSQTLYNAAIPYASASVSYAGFDYAGVIAIPPINIRIGKVTPTTDITAKVDLTTLRIEETGNQEGASCDFVLFDRDQSFSQMRGEWRIQVDWRNPVTGAMQDMFLGFIRSPSAEAFAIYGNLAVHAEDAGTLLDRTVMEVKRTRKGADDKTDRARIQWLFGGAEGRDGTKVAQPLLQLGLSDWSKVQVLNNAPGTQTFGASLTLRQALERILSQSSDDGSADYFLDPKPRLWTFDAGSIASVLDSSPYDIDMTHSPGAGKVAPEDLVVEWDSDNLWTGYAVTAAKAGLSRTYLDSDPFPALAVGRLPGPYGVDLYGRRIGPLHAPDANTLAKVQRVVRAALRDTRNPVPRVTFSVSGTSCYDATTGVRWRGGQRVNVKSVIHGLNGSGTDAGPWAGSSGSAAYQLMPLRIKSVATTFESGTGTMRMEVTAGGRRKHLFAGPNG